MAENKACRAPSGPPEKGVQNGLRAPDCGERRWVSHDRRADHALLAPLTRRCGRGAKTVLLQQLPFFAWPGGQKPPRPPPWPGSTTTEPLGVYTAQPDNRAANKVNARSIFMGDFASY